MAKNDSDELVRQVAQILRENQGKIQKIICWHCSIIYWEGNETCLRCGRKTDPYTIISHRGTNPYTFCDHNGNERRPPCKTPEEIAEDIINLIKITA